MWALMCLPLLAVPLCMPGTNLGVCLAVQGLLSTSQPATVLRAFGRQGFLEKSRFQTGLHIPIPVSAMSPRPAHCILLEISKHRKKRDEIQVPSSRQACDECVLVPSPALRCWLVITSYFGLVEELWHRLSCKPREQHNTDGSVSGEG